MKRDKSGLAMDEYSKSLLQHHRWFHRFSAKRAKKLMMSGITDRNGALFFLEINHAIHGRSKHGRYDWGRFGRLPENIRVAFADVIAEGYIEPCNNRRGHGLRLRKDARHVILEKKYTEPIENEYECRWTAEEVKD